MPILGQYLIDLSVSVMVGGSLALFFLAVSVGVLLMDGRVPPRWLWIAIAAQLTLAAEIIEAQEKRRQAGLSFSPYEAHKEVLRAAADFDELRTIMEARS